MEQEVRQQWIQGERLMAKKKETIRRGSKEWWAKKSAEAPELENKRFKYKSPSFKQSEYGKTTYYQKGEDGKFRYSEDYVPVKGAMEKREDVTYVPIEKRFDRETGGFKATPVRETKVESGTPEVETPEVRPTETTDSYPGEDAVRELWGNNMPPPDLVNWVKKGSKEGDVWTRNKDSNTVVYNEKVGTFSISSDMPNQPIPDGDTAWEEP